MISTARDGPRGDRIRSLIMAVRREARGPTFFSWAHPVHELVLLEEVPRFTMESSRSRCARDPGSRAKIGVMSDDSSLTRLVRLRWNQGQPREAVRSGVSRRRRSTSSRGARTLRLSSSTRFSLVTVSQVVIDEEESRIEVVVPDD